MSQYISTTIRNDYTQEVGCPLCRDVIVDACEEEEDDEEEEEDDMMTMTDSSEISDEYVLEPDEDGNIINVHNLFVEPAYDEDESDTASEIQYDDVPGVASMKLVTKKVIDSGFTMMDLVSIFFNRYNKEDPKYSRRNINCMVKKIYAVIDDLDEETGNEYNERLAFEQEDVRV
jgi:hypothetical protein